MKKVYLAELFYMPVAMMCLGGLVMCAGAENEISAEEIFKSAFIESEHEHLYKKAKSMSESYPRIYQTETTNEIWNLFVDLCFYTGKNDPKTIPDLVSNRSHEQVLKYHQSIDMTKMNVLERTDKILELYTNYFKLPENTISAQKPTEDSDESIGCYEKMNIGIKKIWDCLTKDLREKESKDYFDSKILQKNDVVVPGGRFQEAYYWDFFWMAKGLLISGKEKAVDGMISNFIDQINKFGFIPNGTRWYYINRSQPPYFAQILLESMDEFKKLKDIVSNHSRAAGQKPNPETSADYINLVVSQPLIKEYQPAYLDNLEKKLTKEKVDALYKEMKFWVDNRCVEFKDESGQRRRMFRYGSKTATPRVEMLIPDLISNENYQTTNKSAGPFEYYKHIIASTESGWDFSSRWRQYNTNTKMYGFLNTHNIIPVDLNSILVKNFNILAEIYNINEYKNVEQSIYWKNLANSLSSCIDDLMWDAEHTRWRDLILIEKEGDYYYKKREDSVFYHSDLHPLYMGIVNDPNNHILSRNAKNIWISEDVMLPCTSTREYAKESVQDSLCGMLQKTAEDALTHQNEIKDQWDGKSIWPPLVHLTIEYLIRSNNIDLAKRVAQSYMAKMNKHYIAHGNLPEKIEYEAKNTGEYKMQKGFGWSIGVAQWIYYIFDNNLIK
ncbi:alpha,alpha-trehalase [Nematocida sp. ERTm5]|nr:alpha,alpha-trehalase [Nematocida sp. ERTm5]